MPFLSPNQSNQQCQSTDGKHLVNIKKKYLLFYATSVVLMSLSIFLLAYYYYGVV